MADQISQFGGNDPRAGHRDVWRLAGPIILANLSIPLLGAVDTAVIGHSDHVYNLSAVAIGSTIIHFLFWAFGFLRMGVTGFAAQARGANDAPEVRALVLRSLAIACSVGVLLWLLQFPIITLSLSLFDGSSEAKDLATDYFQIRIWSAPVVLINYCLMGWFIGMQNTRAVLILQVLMNGLNIVLDLYFVLGLEWGVAGVAAATVIAEVTATLAAIWLYRREVAKFDPGGQAAALWQPAKIKRMLSINFDIFIRTICLLSAFAFFTSQASGFGDATTAAHLVLIQFQGFLAFGLDGFAHAAEALVGGAIGAKKRDALRNAVKIASLWAVLIAAGYALIYAILGDLIIAVLTGMEDVQNIAGQYLPWIILSPIISVWSFMLDGVFIGATLSREMRNGMIISLVLFAALTLILKPVLGYHGVWLAFILFMASRALTLGIFYPRVERAAINESV